MLYCVLEQDSLCQDIYRVYWPWMVKIFGTVSKVVTEDESTLLLYLAQQFANTGSIRKIFTLFSMHVIRHTLLQLSFCLSVCLSVSVCHTCLSGLIYQNILCASW